MQINESEKFKEYSQELAHAMKQLSNNLAQCQMIMGVIESFIHLREKEMMKKPTEANGLEVK